MVSLEREDTPEGSVADIAEFADLPVQMLRAGCKNLDTLLDSFDPFRALDHLSSIASCLLGIGYIHLVGAELQLVA